jgi:hypothetical protein
MPLPSSHTVLSILLFFVAVALGWTLLKAVLKTTARLTAIGCLVVVIVGAAVWLAVRLG